MHLSEAELEILIADLEDQYRAICREYAETDESELKAELTDVFASVEYLISRLEKQRLELQQMKARQIELLLADLRAKAESGFNSAESQHGEWKVSVHQGSSTRQNESGLYAQVCYISYVA